ncbi:MAG: hypothetical protein M0002_08100 [Rhodospirillales bacterium]|nr:hypothetical protein [Rhodospirillales bacterium]
MTGAARGWLGQVWLGAEGITEAADRFLNALAGGLASQTISERAALAKSRGKMWGCALCRYLSWTVERHHCARTLAGIEERPAAAVLAGVQLALAAAALAGAVRLAQAFVAHLL